MFCSVLFFSVLCHLLCCVVVVHSVISSVTLIAFVQGISVVLPIENQMTKPQVLFESFPIVLELYFQRVKLCYFCNATQINAIVYIRIWEKVLWILLSRICSDGTESSTLP